MIRKLRDQPGVAGSSIRLTIDVELQQYIQNLLGNQKGSVVVLDPRDSSVLAMVTNPSYDNNLFVGGVSGRIINAYWKILLVHYIAVPHKGLILRLLQ
ncbi:penicillin-binding protein 2 [Actinobacillus equuli]|nr:penicillin-binding protein 2 [Actinobacillus equuli]